MTTMNNTYENQEIYEKRLDMLNLIEKNMMSAPFIREDDFRLIDQMKEDILYLKNKNETNSSVERPQEEIVERQGRLRMLLLLNEGLLEGTPSDSPHIC